MEAAQISQARHVTCQVWVSSVLSIMPGSIHCGRGKKQSWADLSEVAGLCHWNMLLRSWTLVREEDVAMWWSKIQMGPRIAALESLVGLVSVWRVCSGRSSFGMLSLGPWKLNLQVFLQRSRIWH